MTPELKAVVVDVYESRGGRRAELTRRYGGRLEIAGTGRVTMTMQSMGRFLSWEELPLAE